MKKMLQNKCVIEMAVRLVFPVWILSLKQFYEFRKVIQIIYNFVVRDGEAASESLVL